jgi:hypothetical protein
MNLNWVINQWCGLRPPSINVTEVVRRLILGVGGGGGLQMWRMAANILNEQSRTADKGRFSSWVVGRGPNKCYRSKTVCYGIALGYGLDDRDSRFRFPAKAGNFSLHHGVQNGSESHLASYPMGTRGSFLGGKAAGAWSWPLNSI